ncbi:MAG: hypothetical protein M1831_005282 [Alyxoria varia]|nr:MAG: hypothetical protein M1831_005282 [Alyxoria varia]
MDNHGFKNDGAGFTRPGDPEFTNFPRQTPEDTVFYSVYVVASPPLSLAQSRSRLREIQAAAKELCRALLSGYYIWQREDFHLELEYLSEPCTGSGGSSSQRDGSGSAVDAGSTGGDGGYAGGSNGRWRLSGKTDFGDSIADEWVIVYLLRELTRKFGDAWVRVTDSDGEFLLAEAAYSIPSWLDPDVAGNRVWIHDGGVRVIPRSVDGSGSGMKTAQGSKSTKTRAKAKAQTTSLSLDEALSYLSSNPNDTIKSTSMDSEAFFRLRNYPAQIKESMHTSIVTIPRLLAYILNTKPAHVSPAVEAFYLRDPVSVKPLQGVTGPENLVFPPDDLVDVSVRFTRVGYAQLRGQEFPPPPAWAERFEQPMTKRERYKLEVGMKFTCGFEMLVADPQNLGRKCVREIRILIDEVEGGEETLPSDGEIVASYPRMEDDEGWLDINYEAFEDELGGRRTGGGASKGAGGGESGAFGDKGAQDNLRRIVESFQRFVDDEDAGLEGADFGDASGSDEGSWDGEGEEDSDDEEEGDEVDEDELTRKMKEMMYGPSDGGNDTSRIKELDDSGQEIEANDSEGETEETKDIQETMAAIEQELKSSGALNLEPPKEAGRSKSVRQREEPDETAYASDPQYQLVENLLESLQGQDAGPARNLIASMGLSLPKSDAEER